MNYHKYESKDTRIDYNMYHFLLSSEGVYHMMTHITYNYVSIKITKLACLYDVDSVNLLV